MGPMRALPRASWIPVGLVFGVTLPWFVAFLCTPDMVPFDDGPAYLEMAQQMRQGTIGHYYYPPGTAFLLFPFMMLGEGPDVAMRAFGACSATAFFIGCIALAWSIFRRSNTTIAVGLLAACYPHVVMNASQVSAHVVTGAMLAIALALVLQIRRRWTWTVWTIICVLLGAMIIVRPASLLLIMVIAFFSMRSWLRSDQRSWLSVAGAGSLLVVIVSAMAAPVMWHNHRHGQGWTISTNNEWNLFLANTPYTPSYKTGHFGQREVHTLPPQAQAYIATVLPQLDARSATVAQREAMVSTAFDFMWTHPWQTLWRVSNRMRGYWGMDYSVSRNLQLQYGLSSVPTAILLAIEGGAVVVMLLLAISACIVRPRPLADAGPFLLTVVIASMVPYVVAFAMAKYHTAVMPIVMLPAAVGLVECCRDPRGYAGRLRRSGWWWGMATVVLGVQVEHVYWIMFHR